MISFNILRTKRTLAVTILTAIVILMIILFSLRKETGGNLPVDREGNLLKHSIYSNYVFDNTDKVINIGIQPLYLPTGLISEVMERDMVLQKALQGLGVEVRYYPFLKGNDVNFFLQNKDLDIGIGGDMPAISAAAKMNIIIPVTLQQGFTSIVAPRPMLTSQLRGKRIAYPFAQLLIMLFWTFWRQRVFQNRKPILSPWMFLNWQEPCTKRRSMPLRSGNPSLPWP